MRRFTSGIAAVVALGALSGTAAADPAAAPSSRPGAPTAAKSTTAPKATAPATGQVTLRKVVCLNVSLHCFSVSSAASSQGTTPAKTFDLHAPDIRNLYSEAELRRPVDDPYEEVVTLEDQQVKVEGARPDPTLPIGILSLPWAVMHPTQAWRIFAPVPSAK